MFTDFIIVLVNLLIFLCQTDIGKGVVMEGSSQVIILDRSSMLD